MKRQPIPAQPVKQVHSQMVFVSASNVDEQHRTQIFTDGTSHCTCEGFKYRQDCRHTKALRKAYVVVEFAGDYAIALNID